VSDLQTLIANWLTQLAAVLPVGVAFAAGMVAAVNPCGFAMLPAYLSLYLGAGEEGFGRRSPVVRLLRALLVGLTVSSGFVLLFGAAGILISAGATLLVDVMPALGIVIGGLLVLSGLWMLAARTPHAGVFGRLAGQLGDPGTVGVPGFFMFGLAYEAASLSCTLPVFLAVVGSRWSGAASPQAASYQEQDGSSATAWVWPRCWWRLPWRWQSSRGASSSGCARRCLTSSSPRPSSSCSQARTSSTTGCPPPGESYRPVEGDRLKSPDGPQTRNSREIQVDTIT
jgi:cytochrome c biogenesis protein CcdA